MTTDIRDVLQGRIREAEADLEKLRAALAALDVTEAPGGRTTEPAAARTPARRRAVKRKATVVPLGKLVKVIGDQPGITTSVIAKETGGDSSAILALLKEHEGDQVRREGERRATRWFVITDADRIAKRAAELEAQRKSARPRRAKAAA